MRKREVGTSDNSNIRMLTTEQGALYAGMGKTAFREWADKIQATRHFGRCVRFDRVVIDKALDVLQTQAG